ncbi:MAG: dihydrolipoyl dehydrogenase, partial [Gammaproteobacteria bacterium]
MTHTIEVKVPDIGDFDSVEIIEILVAAGDEINVEDALITVESDKASMEIPSSDAGIVKSLKVNMGDHISQGNIILELETSSSSKVSTQVSEKPAETPESTAQESVESTVSEASASTVFDAAADIQAQVVVLGSGPGGYTAAFRAADLGKQVVLIEKDNFLGGVCLNVGCIPSKALLHVAEVVSEAREFSDLGVTFQEPEIDTDKLRAHKNKVVGRLTGGLKQLA